jgi:hypothetical protein
MEKPNSYAPFLKILAQHVFLLMLQNICAELLIQSFVPLWQTTNAQFHQC